MNEKTIKRYITILNRRKAGDLIFTRPLTSTVDFAKVWKNPPSPKNPIIGNEAPYDFYFIRNNENKYIGAVLDMGNDLHWFILVKHRKKGYLTNALKDCILPHIFMNRKAQIITIDQEQIGMKNFEASRKVALKLGFTEKINAQNEKAYTLTKRRFKNNSTIIGTNFALTIQSIDELRRRINYTSKC